MSTLLGVAGGLCAVVVIVLLVPLLRPARGGALVHELANKRIYQERLVELGREREAGQIDDADVEQIEAELARTLLNDVSSGEQARSPVRRSTQALATVVTTAIVLVSFAYYYATAYNGEVATWEAARDGHRAAVAQFLSNPTSLPAAARHDPGAFVRVLQAHLVGTDSTDPAHWSALGTIYVRAQRPGMAIPALERALRIDQERVSTKVALAEALMQRDRGRVPGRRQNQPTRGVERTGRR